MSVPSPTVPCFGPEGEARVAVSKGRSDFALRVEVGHHY